MSGSNSSDSNPSSPDLTEVDPNFSPDITDNNPITTPVVTRSQARTKVKISPNHIINLIDLDQSINSQTNNPFNNTTMSELSLETAIKLIPCFNGQNEEDIYSFLNACEFAVSSVKDICKPTLVKAITTKLSGKAFAVTQNREIIDWAGLKSLLETAFCAKRTPGYLQLELNSTRQKPGEAVQEYSGRVEKLFHELCNVSVNGRKPVEAEAVRSYIKETTLTSYVEGLHQNLRQIVKSKNLISLEEAIKESLEEEKLLESNRETRRLFQNNNRTNANTIQKYCSICKKNNHNTSQCRFAKENRYRQNSDQKVKDTQPTGSIQKLSCTYCKAKGHERDDCFKKKRMEKRQTENQQNMSGNGPRPSTSGEHSVKDIRMSAQM